MRNVCQRDIFSSIGLLRDASWQWRSRSRARLGDSSTDRRKGRDSWRGLSALPPERLTEPEVGDATGATTRPRGTVQHPVDGWSCRPKRSAYRDKVAHDPAKSLLTIT
jgi:hypothetical protein